MAMSLERRQRVAMEKKQLIMQAALHLFDEKGYGSTTIADIALKAGISKGLIYKYFASKEEILVSFKDDIYECENLVKNQENSIESLRLFTKRVLLKYEYTGYRAPIRILISCYIHGDIKKAELIEGFSFKYYGRNFLGPIIKRGQDSGEIVEGNSEELGDFFWHMIIGYTVQILNLKEELNPSDIETIIGIVKKQN